jgi:hypothetical protein
MLTCANTVEFLRARGAWEKRRNPDDLNRMQEIAKKERENSVAAIPIYKRSRWLDPALFKRGGWFHSADEMLEAKIAWIDRFRLERARVDFGGSPQPTHRKDAPRPRAVNATRRQ